MQEHEYVVLGGINRVKVGRYLGTISASVSAAVVFIILSVVDIANQLGLPTSLPPSVLSLVGAGAVFTVLSSLLNRYLWRWKHISKFLRVPDLNGERTCEGHTLPTEKNPEYFWQSKIYIIQSWDKIRVRLKGEKSGSNSISAALICDDTDGYRLFYSYRNDPKISELDLQSHRGFAELVFSKDRQTAEGEYFNGHGRYTFGTMKLTRT